MCSPLSLFFFFVLVSLPQAGGEALSRSLRGGVGPPRWGGQKGSLGGGWGVGRELLRAGRGAGGGARAGTMGRKGVKTKHTAKDLQARAAASLQNKGGGKEGKADRLGGAAGHSKFHCHICMMTAPSLTTMEQHWNSKHDKLGPFDPTKFTDKQKEAGGTTKGVGVRGSIKKKK